MITPEDLIHLPYPPDLTQAGILHALRSLALGRIQADNLHIDPLRRLVAAVAAELALRRHLAVENISFKTRQSTPFTQSDWGDIVLGGRQCHLVDNLIARRSILQRVKDKHANLLQAPASLPEVNLHSEGLEHHDLLIFAFILANPQPSWHEIRQTQDNSLPSYFAYIMPKAWKNPTPGRAYSQLTLTNESEGEIAIELGGRGVTGQYQSENLHLPPRQSVDVAKDYTALAYLSVERISPGQISLSRAGLVRPLKIPTHRWVNLWLDGIGIILAGYMTVGEFHNRARHLPSPDPSWDDLSIQTPTMSLPVSELHSFPQLFAWIKSIF